MDIIFLGTSSGTPTKARNVTAIALLEEKGSGWYLIDCGEATQHQLLRTSLSLNELHAIFITHVHGDHCYGLPGLLASAGMSGRQAPLKIFAPLGIEQWIRNTMENTQLYLPYELQFFAAETLVDFQDRNLMISSVELSHRVPSFAYHFIETNAAPMLDTEKLRANGIAQGPLWGQLIKGEDVVREGVIIRSEDYLLRHVQRQLVIAGDNDQPELLTAACKNADLLIHEAIYTKDIFEKVGGRGHSYGELVGTFAQSVNLPNLILTHFSPRYQANPALTPSINNIADEATAVYSGKLFMAEDFARFRLSRAGEVKKVDL